MNNLYYEFAMNVKSKLCDDINGRVVFEIYDNIDSIIFKVNFKDFEYRHPVNGIQEHIYSGGTAEEIADEFKKDYMKAIKKAFFKTDNHKRRDEMVRMGVAE